MRSLFQLSFSCQLSTHVLNNAHFESLWHSFLLVEDAIFPKTTTTTAAISHAPVQSDLSFSINRWHPLPLESGLWIALASGV